MADGSTRPSQANAANIVREFTAVEKPAVPLQIGNPGLTMVVDNTYRMYLSGSTNVRALSRSLETIEIDARLAIDLGTGKFDVVWPTIPPEQRNVIMCDF